MEDLLEKLQRERAQLLEDVLEVEHNDRAVAERRVQSLRGVYEELELVAAAAAPFLNAEDQRNPNPEVLTEEFYASYMLVLLLAKDLNDSRFLWKRIADETKQGSQLLEDVWAIGKALWKRDFMAAYAAMTKTWPNIVAQLVEALRASTRQSTAELLSAAYATVAFSDATHALGFSDEASLAAYCSTLGWEVDQSNQLIRPKVLPRATSQAAALQQLETLSDYVLHLEQSTLIKLT